MSEALNILDSVRALFRGERLQIVKSADERENQVQSVPPDARVGAASPDEDALEDAREEAQAGQQQGQGTENMPGVGGSQKPEPDGDEGKPGPGDGDGDEGEMSKSMMLENFAWLAKHKGITKDEIAKAFSGLEGDPTQGFSPVGKGEELLEKIAFQGEFNTKILEKIAGCLQDFAAQTVALGKDLAKANQEITALKEEVTKGHRETQTAQDAAKAALESVRLLPRTAPAKPAKGLDSMQVSKAIQEKPNLTHTEIADMILAGKLSSQEGTVYGRMLNYGHLGGAN
jgi:hypothetical protein